MKVLVAGDFYPRARVKQMVQEGNYVFFDELKERISNVDYSIVNFESPVVEGEAIPIVKAGPNLKCHPNAMKAIKYAGFKCVTLANNHFYDYGEIGVSDTLRTCQDEGIDYVGGGKNLDEAESILYKRIGDKTLAIISFCENEWSIATGHSGGSAPLNLIHNLRNLQEAKAKADNVLVIVHGGTEKYQLPSPRMKETYRFFVDQGADAVVNHHQHCYSGYEVYKGKPIFYGLGNLCWDINNPQENLWNEGLIVELCFNEDEIGYKVLPYTQCVESPKVSFVTDSRAFDENLEKINAIIGDDDKLQESFLKMAREKGFLQFLEPYNNKYLKLLKAKGLLPSFLNEKKRRTILSIFRCESHRDVMFELLKN